MEVTGAKSIAEVDLNAHDLEFSSAIGFVAGRLVREGVPFEVVGPLTILLIEYRGWWEVSDD